jgi:hypothetical protein
MLKLAPAQKTMTMVEKEEEKQEEEGEQEENEGEEKKGEERGRQAEGNPAAAIAVQIGNILAIHPPHSNISHYHKNHLLCYNKYRLG